MYQNLKICWDKFNKYSLVKFVEYIDSLSDEEIQEITDNVFDTFLDLGENEDLIFPHGCEKQIRIFAGLLCEKVIRLYDIKNEITKDTYKRIKRNTRYLLKEL